MYTYLTLLHLKWSLAQKADITSVLVILELKTMSIIVHLSRILENTFSVILGFLMASKRFVTLVINSLINLKCKYHSRANKLGFHFQVFDS